MNDEKNKIISLMADNLGVLRKKIRITQEELAERIGVSRHTIIALEAKKKDISWNVCLALISVFSEDKESKVLMELLGIIGEEYLSIVQLGTNGSEE